MRTYAGKHLDQSLCIRSRTLASLVYLIYEDHHLADRGVVTKHLKVVCDLLDSLVVDLGKCAVILLGNVGWLGKEIPYSCDETLCTLHIA